MIIKRLVLGVIIMLIVGGFPIVPAGAQAPDTRGYVLIPRIDLVRRITYASIVDGWHDLDNLGDEVAHLEGTTWISDRDWGRVVLAGHNPGAFERVDELRPGDWIYVVDTQELARYQVVFSRTAPVSNIDWLAPTDGPTLLLMTCTDDETIRRIVQAERVENE